MVELRTIRLANHDDVDTIVAFNAAMAFETEHRQLDLVRLRNGVEAILSTPQQGFYILAEIFEGNGYRQAAQLMVTFEWSDWRNGVFWWVQSVYVSPDYRRQGIFRAMYHYIKAKANADPNVCGIRLYVERENSAAQTVYQRVGFIPSVYRVFEQDFVLGHQVP